MDIYYETPSRCLRGTFIFHSWDFIATSNIRCKGFRVLGLVFSLRGELLEPRVSIIFRWFDFWVGLYLDRKDKILYIFPIPMIGIKIRLNKFNDKPSA